MDNNNEQETGFDVINDDNGDDLVDFTFYRGGRPVNIPNVPFRLIIHASVTVLHSFYRCRMVREVIFRGTNVIVISRHAFQSCSNLERIELPAGLLRLEDYAFHGCTSLRKIVIPASVQFMGDVVFEGCTSLESVIFAPRTSNVELGHFMFRDCSDLRFVTLPPNLRSIPRGCFQGCTSLTHLHIPESVEEIEGDALYGSGIQSIHVPKQVHRIRSGAFQNCAFLERITFHSINLNLRPDIFGNCPLLSIIQIAPWLWPKLFVSMKGQPDFLFKFFREYHTKIFDFETPVVRRPLQRLRRDRKRTASMIDDAI